MRPVTNGLTQRVLAEYPGRPAFDAHLGACGRARAPARGLVTALRRRCRPVRSAAAGRRGRTSCRRAGGRRVPLPARPAAGVTFVPASRSTATAGSGGAGLCSRRVAGEHDEGVRRLRRRRASQNGLLSGTAPRAHAASRIPLQGDMDLRTLEVAAGLADPAPKQSSALPPGLARPRRARHHASARTADCERDVPLQ